MPHISLKNADNVVLFDGVCNLCNSTVSILIRIDKSKKLRYASLQSLLGREVTGLTNEHPDDLKSIFFIQDGKKFVKSGAVLQIFKTLGGIYKLMYFFRYVPRPIRDQIYDFVAKNRYRWFGKKNHCRVMQEEEKILFLDA
ncbi:MAG: thiol-disulfide oxidoreductase DCC family protein [Cyclobacteriaceae bacterium]